MEQLNGKHWYLGSVVVFLPPRAGHLECGCIICKEDETKRDFSIAWIPIASSVLSSTYVLFEAILEEISFTLHCKTT